MEKNNTCLLFFFKDLEGNLPHGSETCLDPPGVGGEKIGLCYEYCKAKWKEVLIKRK